MMNLEVGRGDHRLPAIVGSILLTLGSWQDSQPRDWERTMGWIDRAGLTLYLAGATKRLWGKRGAPSSGVSSLRAESCRQQLPG